MRKAGIFVLSVLGFLLLAVGTLLGVVAVRGGEAVGEARFIIGVVGIAGFAAGARIFKLARQIRIAPGETVLAQHRGPIVTYLRSFQADQDADKAKGARSSIADAFAPARLRSLLTEEEQIAVALEDVGPLLAIGRPGERLPQLGAHRVYTDDANWQAKVSELLDRSSLVLMRAGETGGFWWEVDHVRRHMSPERVVVLLPKSEDEYERFRARVAPRLPRPLPDYCPGRSDASFGGLLWFDADWTPRIETSRLGLNASRNVISADLRRMLGGVLRRLGVSPPEVPPIKVRLFAALLDLAIVMVPTLASLLLTMSVTVPEPVAVVMLIVMFVPIALVVLLEMTPLRASPGKWLMKLKVYDASGVSPRTMQLAIRCLLRLVSAIFWYVSLPVAALTRGRTLHDLIAGTVVLTVEPSMPDVSDDVPQSTFHPLPT